MSSLPLGTGDFWDAREGSANTYPYQRHACVACMPYLGTAKHKGGQNKMQDVQIIWENISRKLSHFLKKKRKK